MGVVVGGASLRAVPILVPLHLLQARDGTLKRKYLLLPREDTRWSLSTLKVQSHSFIYTFTYSVMFYIQCHLLHTVEPLIMDTPRSGKPP